MTDHWPILFRRLPEYEDEREIATDIWDGEITPFRTQIPEDSMVIGRMSTFPFYEELWNELQLKNSRLVNSPGVRRWITEMEWVRDLEEDNLTPRTWFNKGYANVPETDHGWVVKGRVNSRKFQWDSMMRARNRDELENVMRNLRHDQRIADQGLVIREYVPLEKVDEGINDMPITNEWRFFFLDGQEVASGFYWAIVSEDKLPEENEPPQEAKMVAKKAQYHLEKVYEYSFVVVDVAKTKAGKWIVIELNDAQQSGLSTIDPFLFYNQLSKICT
jgi:hypothetical protein